MPLSLLSPQHLHFRPPTCLICSQRTPNHVTKAAAGAAKENQNGSFNNPQFLFPGTLAGRLVKLQCMLHGYSLLPSFQKSSSGQACRYHSSKVSETYVESLYFNQDILYYKRFPSVILLTNALAMAVPFDALAETCQADNSFFNMPLLLSIALIGATVGGLLARQRKGELQRVNEQLRQINAALRRQAKIESYAPSLSYAPNSARIPESEVIVDPRKQELISRLKSGKNYLRNQNPEKAFEEFKEALELAQNLNDPTEEKKAARGLGASLQRQGKYRDAIKYHSMVLSISQREGEDSGNVDAYGAIADCYTELGELENAGKFYDQYIARLQTD